MKGTFYNNEWSYEENYKKGPVGLKDLSLPAISPKEKYSFLGIPVTIPFGIPAGPLLNSEFTHKAFEWGFSISTYKTVRANTFPCHPFPNVLFVDIKGDLHPNKTSRVFATSSTKKSVSKLSITNSFGVPSKDPKVWKTDVKKALSYRKKGDLLIVSFMGTVRKNQTKEEFIQDFAQAGLYAKSTGAKVLEANLSCPNIGNEGLVCYDLLTTERVCSEIRKRIGNTHLVLKVGYYTRGKDIEKLSEITQKYAQAIATINTLQVEVVNRNGTQALPGPMRLKSGVCGAAIKWAGIEMIKKLEIARKRYGYTFKLIGIGGVMSASDFFQYRDVGADVVQSATGSMWNPYLAKEISAYL